MSQLTASDLHNLLLLHQKRSAFWTKDGLMRCEGLISRDGFTLLPDGIRKVERLLEGVEELKRGVPISRRFSNRSEKALEDQWYRAQINGNDFVFNSTVILYGRVQGMKVTPAELSHKRYFLFTISAAQKKRDSWMKVIPYAVQIDGFPGVEVICFHSLDNKRFWRMQSKYYDLVARQFSNINWWIKGSGRSGITAKFQTNHCDGLGSRIAAIVLPLDPDTTHTTPFPSIS